jgi:DMSO reductase anchor subunit
MHPAWSVILFTVTAGMGQGLMLMLVRASAAGADRTLLGCGGATAVVLLTFGLACSFFHLGRPERAWRAATMWRTSWLSREVIVLPLAIALVALWSAAQWTGHAAAGALGVAVMLATVALWVCTGMIYACLKFLREWAHPLTVVNFTLLGAMSGATLFAAVFAAPMGMARDGFLVALILTLTAGVGRLASLVRNRRLKPLSTPQSALGIHASKLKQMSQGATGGSFNTREFFHGRTAGFVRQVKWIALGLAFAVPLVALVMALAKGSAGYAALALVSQVAGLLAERWLFFAQANHPQNIYYQAVA